MPRQGNSSMSLTEFRNLLKDSLFIDYFNKFICLPAFAQLVVFSQERQEFLLEPNLPRNQYVLNRNGLLEWFWRKRLSLFVKSRMFHEYHLAQQLAENSVKRIYQHEFSPSEESAMNESINWLIRKCFGSVSAMRKFRLFLQKTPYAFEMYQFWLDAERLYHHIKRRSRSSMDLFNQLKEKFFAGSGRMKFPQHLLDAAWGNLPDVHKTNAGRRDYDIKFTLCMQKLCLQRLKTYWQPRYLTSAKIKARTPQEKAYYSLAILYLRGANLQQELVKTCEKNKLKEPTDEVTSGSDVTTTSQNLFFDDVRGSVSSASSEKKKTKVSFKFHAPPGLSSSDEEESSYEEKKIKKRKSKARRMKRSARKSSDGRSDKSTSEDNSNSGSGSYDEASEETAGSGEKGVSSSGGESSESWEGVHDKFRKSKKTKKFQFQGRHISRAVGSRKQKFEQLLQTSSHRRTSVTADQINVKIKTKGKRKTSQKIVDNAADNIDDEIALGGSWETTESSAPASPTTTSSRRMSGVVNRPDALNLDNIGGKALLKAALRIPSITSPSKDSDSDGFLGTTGSFWDLTHEDLSSNMLRKNSGSFDGKFVDGSSMMLSKLSGPGRRLSRKGSQDSVGSTATMVTAVKKRRPSVRIKPRKTKVTTLTFSLSGDGPTENSQQKVLKDEKPQKAEKKKMPQKATKKKTPAKAIEKLPLVPTQSKWTFTLERDYSYRNEPKNRRMIIALQTDHVAAHPFQQFLINTDNGELLDYLNFWQDVEKIRWDYPYGSMTFVVFIESVRSVVTQYLLPTSPFHIESPENLRKAIIFEVLTTDLREIPWELRKLQMEVLEDLKYSYDAYCAQEIQSFYNAAAFKTEEESFFDAQNSHLPAIQSSSNSPIIKSLPDYDSLQYNQSQKAKKTSVKVENEMMENVVRIENEMNARMMRAHKLLIESNLPSGRIQIPICEIQEENSNLESDEDGRMGPPISPRQILAPPVDLKILASRSARQYPNPKHPTGTQTKVKAAKRHPNSALFFKPIKRGGHFLKRPMTRPLNFYEVLHDQTHVEFFKRYLKAYRSDTPFLFWIAVEALRNTDNVKERQNKAKAIIKRYFHNSKVPAIKMLQCTADIIREIPYLDVVTTSMLLTVQNVVASTIEDRWFRKYADTFTDAMFIHPSDAVSVTDKSVKLKRGHLKRAWVIFNDFIKRAARFMRCMKEERFVFSFREFLKREIDRDDAVRAPNDSMQSDVVAKRSVTTMPLLDLSRSMGPERERKGLKQRIINGQLVTYELLHNDLNFWREIQCYKSMADCSTAMEAMTKEPLGENEMLKWKAKLIVDCYIDSSILPAVRVNVPQEVADITTEALHNGLIDRALFHEATIYVFPLLLIFWKRFCNEYYKYVPTLSKRFKRIYGLKMTPVIAEAMRRQKGRQNKHEVQTETALKKKQSTRIKTADLPDYLHMDPKKFKKRRGSPFGAGDDMSPRLTFSVSKGVTLIDPIRRRKYNVMKNGSPEIRLSNPSTAVGGFRSTSSRNQSSPRTTPRQPNRRAAILDTNILEHFARLSMPTENK